MIKLWWLTPAPRIVGLLHLEMCAYIMMKQGHRNSFLFKVNNIPYEVP